MYFALDARCRRRKHQFHPKVEFIHPQFYEIPEMESIPA